MKAQLSGISETALITLAAHARDFEREDSVLKDDISADIARQLGLDCEAYVPSVTSYFGVVARASMFEDYVRAFAAHHANPLVISIGSGLDSLFNRVDDGRMRWVNLDLPEVIEQRKRFYPAHERVRDVARSLLDPAWPDDIDWEGYDVAIIAEGVLMFFSPDEVATFVRIAAEGIDAFDLAIDMISPKLVGQEGHHGAVKRTSAAFRWGSSDGSDVVDMCPALQRLDCVNYTKRFCDILPMPHRLASPFYRLALPPVNNRMGIYRKN